jgi:oligopeptide transport system ATP-binding protein
VDKDNQFGSIFHPSFLYSNFPFLRFSASSARSAVNILENGKEPPLLEVRNLVKHFPQKAGFFSRKSGKVVAVDGVSFRLRERETLGLVGESGCGKSTTGRIILTLLRPTAGEVLFQGRNVHSLKKEELRRLRKEMQIIFQDPYASLNPRMTVGQILGEALRIHHHLSGKAARERMKDLLEAVGMSADQISRYPHEFSGGQRQRIGVARALAVQPKLIICDEPVSALDVSVQAQVLNLLQDLKRGFNLTYLFIAHDLAVVRHISDRIAVMYVGKIVEMADRDAIYESPLHPYTQALLQAIPIPDPHFRREYKPLEGDLPSPLNLPPGCRFHTRCARTMEVCRREQPAFLDMGKGHYVACHLVPQLSRE